MKTSADKQKPKDDAYPPEEAERRRDAALLKALGGAVRGKPKAEAGAEKNEGKKRGE